MLIHFLAFLLCIAAAESPNAPQSGQHELRGGLSYFSTTSNFGDGGESEDLINGGEFTNYLVDAVYTYDWRPDWRFYGGGQFSVAESFDGGFTRSNSGLSDLSVGAQKWFESGKFDIAPQVDVVYPFFKTDSGADEALLGEGALRVRAGSWGFLPLDWYVPYAYLGFEYRDGGRSYLLPYNVGVKFKIQSWWIQGEFRGQETVVEDVDTDVREEREAYLRRANGGSYRFYSVNPAFSELALEGGTSFGRWGGFAGMATTLMGRNAAEGMTLWAGLTFQFSAPVAPMDPERERRFEIGPERYDQTLFEDEVAVPKPKPPAPKRPAPKTNSSSQDMTVELKPKPKPKKRSNKTLEKLMKETEKSLEGEID